MNFRTFLELSDEEAQKVRELAKKRGPVLDHLFNGKDRVFLPLPPDRQFYQLKKILEKIPHPRFPEMPKYKIDFNDLRMGVVRLLQKKNHPEHGEFIDDRNTKSLNKVLVDEKDNPEIKSGNFGDLQGYWIVVTRHPIDVKRMADFPHMQSCHTYGGSYYYCTDEEVEGGGAVAYLITAKDYSELKDQDEIFKDKGGFKIDFDHKMDFDYAPGRNVEGINPIARVRIRMAINKNTGKEVGLVEDRVYGIEQNGNLAQRFVKAVKTWVNRKQPGEEINYKELLSRGGGYKDSSVKDLYHSQYTKNKNYLINKLNQISKLQDTNEIKSELKKISGKNLIVVTKKGKKLWVADYPPTNPKDLFGYTWMNHFLSKENDQFLNKNVFELKFVNDNAMKQLETYVINMLNQNNYGQLIKIKQGWLVLVPAEMWILEDQTSQSTAQRMAFAFNQEKFLEKIKKITFSNAISSLPEKTGEWEVGDIAHHEKLGMGIVTAPPDAPGHSVQVQWKDGSRNYVHPSLLFRSAQAARQ